MSTKWFMAWSKNMHHNKKNNMQIFIYKVLTRDMTSSLVDVIYTQLGYIIGT